MAALLARRPCIYTIHNSFPGIWEDGKEGGNLDRRNVIGNNKKYNRKLSFENHATLGWASIRK